MAARTSFQSHGFPEARRQVSRYADLVRQHKGEYNYIDLLGERWSWPRHPPRLFSIANFKTVLRRGVAQYRELYSAFDETLKAV